MSDIACYRPLFQGTQPDYLHPSYASSIKRAPKMPRVAIPQTLSEVTGPLFGRDEVHRGECNLTRSPSGGEAIGQRIVVSGRVIDESGRPIPHTLIEIWQANAAGRYLHKRDQHNAPLDPNFSGQGHTLTDEHGLYRFITIQPGSYPPGATITTHGVPRTYTSRCSALPSRRAW